MNIGSRALDILIALITRPGELVTKRELMSIVWPDTVVVQANLTVNIVALRRALRDGQNGNRYVQIFPGEAIASWRLSNSPTKSNRQNCRRVCVRPTRWRFMLVSLISNHSGSFTP